VKRLLLTVIASLLLCLFIAGYGAAGQMPEIQLNGVELGEQALIEDGTIYLPLRTVCETLEYKLSWLPKKQLVTLSKSGNKIELFLKENKFVANGQEVYDFGKLLNGKTYMDESFYEDFLGLKVSRDGAYIKVTEVQGNPIIITPKKELLKTDFLTSTVQYPEVSGLQDAEIEQKINAEIKALAEQAKNEGLKNADEMIEWMDSGYTGSPNKCETYFNYRIKYNSNGILSVVFYNYQYTGGAHGTTVQSSKTFDLASGREYQLKDLFAEETDYVHTINHEVKKLMQERGLTESMLSPFESIRADQGFYLTNDALVIYFQQYEYFPYAVGIPEFEIEYPVFQEMLLLKI